MKKDEITKNELDYYKKKSKNAELVACVYFILGAFAGIAKLIAFIKENYNLSVVLDFFMIFCFVCMVTDTYISLKYDLEIKLLTLQNTHYVKQNNKKTTKKH